MMQVFHIATECTGIASVGGLGDVVYQMAKQCALAGLATTVIVPRYGTLDDGFQARFGERIRAKLRTAEVFPVRLWFPGKTDPDPDDTEPVRFAEIDLPLDGTTLRACLVDSPRFGRRPAAYGRPAYPDVYPMNVLLQKAALTYIGSKASDRGPTVVHGHDAHVATLALAACRSFLFGGKLKDINYIFTAHNLGWGLRQRLWMSNVEWELNFLAHAFDVGQEVVRDCIVNDGNHRLPGFEPFAAAALYGDHLTIVSEGYCWELRQAGTSETAEGDSELQALSEFIEKHRQAGTLRASLSGITNGIDPKEVGPEAIADAVRPRDVGSETFDWKPAFQIAFLDRLKTPAGRPAYWDQIEDFTGSLDRFLPEEGVLFTYVGRLDRQKGADILARAIEEVFSYCSTAGFCLLGAGTTSQIERTAARFAGRVAILKGRSEGVAKEIFAAGDFLLMPSRFEPCGLTDLRAQLNGSIPVVNQVGGLSKIVNGRTGIGFFGLGDRSILRGLVDGMHRAMEIHGNRDAHTRIKRQANAWVRQMCTWEKVFPAYHDLYMTRPLPRP
jgi:starch synthase